MHSLHLLRTEMMTSLLLFDIDWHDHSDTMSLWSLKFIKLNHEKAIDLLQDLQILEINAQLMTLLHSKQDKISTLLSQSSKFYSHFQQNLIWFDIQFWDQLHHDSCHHLHSHVNITLIIISTTMYHTCCLNISHINDQLNHHSDSIFYSTDSSMSHHHSFKMLSYEKIHENLMRLMTESVQNSVYMSHTLRLLADFIL